MTKTERAMLQELEHIAYLRLRRAENQYGICDEYTDEYRREWGAIYRVLDKLGIEPIERREVKYD